MNYKNKLIITLLTLAFISSPVQAYVTKDYSAQRDLFIKVEAELQKGKLNAYRKHKHALKNYPLYPYLLYKLLSLNLDKVKHSELSEFVKTYHDSPLADKLRNEWLARKAKSQHWKDFLLGYDLNANNDIAMQCQYIHAEITVNNNKDVYKYIPHIWLNSKSQPKECDGVFDKWKNDGGLTRNLLWQRIKLSIQSGNHKLAEFLSQSLGHSERKIVDLWIRTNNDPSIIKKSHYFHSEHSAISEILVHGIKKIAANDPQQAVHLWQTLEKQHKFNESHWGSVVKEIGLALSRRLDFHADKWLASVPASQLGADVYNARLKVAVHANAWETISEVYNSLPQTEKRTEKWQYWHARALEMLGEREASQKALIILSQMRNYYGFLASSRVLKPYAFNHQTTSVGDTEIQDLLNHPSIARAYEFKKLGRPHAGTSEWYKALQMIDDNQRITAAHIATHWDMPNWAIVSLANAANKDDLILRFPQTYADFIHKAAKHNNVDAELLFAITRQESAFIPTAKSSAGALGLMQIMPNTGKMVAQANKESYRHHHELLEPDRNIRLGSKYIRMMLDKHQQNPALAAASYNAGPHRVSTWLPDYDMPADCWIETIPFKETREYVQNVLTYTVIYQQLLGKTPRMNKYMPIINGKRRQG